MTTMFMVRSTSDWNANI